jgi:hypothetical protein
LGLLGAGREGERQERNGEYDYAHGAILTKKVNSDARFENPAKRWPLPSPLLKIIELLSKTNEVGK